MDKKARNYGQDALDLELAMFNVPTEDLEGMNARLVRKPTLKIVNNTEEPYRSRLEESILDLDTIEQIGLQEVDEFGMPKRMQPPNQIKEGITYRAWFKQKDAGDVKTAFIAFPPKSNNLIYRYPNPRNDMCYERN